MRDKILTMMFMVYSLEVESVVLSYKKIHYAYVVGEVNAELNIGVFFHTLCKIAER